MSPIAIVYTTTTGNTQYVAELLYKHLGNADLIELNSQNLSLLNSYKALILCVSTWGKGDMQDTWEALAPSMRGMDLSQQKVAILGLGDQKNYPRNFADAAKLLADLARSCGARLVGTTSTEGYEFSASKSVEQGRFVGCIIDEDNQHDKTEPRLKEWGAVLRKEFADLV